MQATPAPTSAPGSPSASQVLVEDLDPPPQNVDTAPFSVLVKLFQRLQVERKHDKRRKMLDSWFSVCLSGLLLHAAHSDIALEITKGLRSVPCSEAFASPGLPVLVHL